MNKLSLSVMLAALCLSSVSFAQGTASYLADRHAQRNVACASCHVSAPQAGAVVETAQCLACHKSREDVAKRTAGIDPNPHANHMIEQNCNECHNGHKPGQYMCSSCHNLKRTVP